MACSSIDTGAVVNCETLPAGGTRARLIVINFDDIIDWDGTGGKITQLTMAPGTKGYEFTGFKNDMLMSSDVATPGVGLNQFLHKTGLIVYDRTQAQKNNVEKLARGRFVVIAELKGKDDDSIIVLGKDVGVEIVVGAIWNAHENGGFFKLSFSTPEGDFESKLPQTLGASYGAGMAIIADVLSS